MLTTLRLKNFIFIDEITLAFKPGMTALTGETGAGKSILCDALWLALGASYDKSMIQEGKPDCHIEAFFNIDNIFNVQKWLKKEGYIENYLEKRAPVCCYIKRVVSQKGRGQIWINEKPAKIKDLQWLKTHLVGRHSQHDQQKLLTSEYQRECLDRYGGYVDLLQSVEAVYNQYNELEKQKNRLLKSIKDQKDQLSLLHYQLEELEKAAVKPNELEDLTQKQRQLSYAHQVLEEGQKALALLSEAEPVHLMSLLQTIQQAVQKVASLDQRFDPISHTMERAHLELTEAETDLRYTLSEVTVDPLELSQVEERLSALHDLGRKHNVDVEKLPDLEDSLQQKYKSYENNKSELAKCEKELAVCLEHYGRITAKLTEARKHAITQLEKSVTEKIQELGMPGGSFVVQLKPLADKTLTSSGKDQVICFLSATRGQPLQPLAKGASGGELSRLSLVIQSLIAEKTSVSTLIFDEVDVGVGGSVAERMGLLLQKLSQTKQVLCITHLPQVAVLASNHYCIEKHTQTNKTVTQVVVLKSEKERVKEIARMLGGIYITDKTIAYAKSMLKLD